VEAARESSRSQ